MCRECGWGMWMGTPGGAAAAGLPTPCVCSAWGRERGLSLSWGFHWQPSSAALPHPAASARRGKQGCSDTEQGFVRSREPRLGRNPKMRFAIKARSGKQGWWRIRRCHPPAPTSGRGEAERHALARGSRPLSLGGMDPELVDKNVPNLHVMKAMQSLKSRGYVKEQFAWRHFYWYLTNEGIQYLRDYLHLPPEIVPATLRRSRPETGRPRPKGLEGERPARLTRGEADRDTYRRSAVPPGADKKAEAGAGAATEFQFRGGFGRGRGQPPQ
uniref:Ribosomal protein S10 n=1 Tax=Ficedula albicollis TaxID=59894 RepID=A0A803WD94_FICAL